MASLPRLVFGRAFLIALLLALVIAGALIFFGDYLGITHRNEYFDLPFGMTQAEVLYVKGRPYSFGAKFDNAGKSSEYSDYSEWSYGGTLKAGSGVMPLITIHFDPIKKSIVEFSCHQSYDSYYTSSPCPTIFGVTTGSSEERVRFTLGKPDTETLDGTTKTMIYQKYGLVFHLSQLAIDDFTFSQVH
jgi:hypothetical protein